MRTHLQKMKMDKYPAGKYPFILLSISVAAYSNFHSVSVWLNRESGIDCVWSLGAAPNMKVCVN